MPAIWVRPCPVGSASTWQNFPHDPVAALSSLEFARCRAKITAALVDALRWKISAPRIAEQDEAATRRQNPQPSGDPLRHRPLVADIAGGDDLPPRIDAVEHIRCGHRDRDPVQRSVRGNRRGSEMIDLSGDYGGGAGLGRSDRNEPRAGAKVEHGAAGDDFRMIEEIAGEHLPAGPGERPVGRWQGTAREGFLGCLPDRGDLGGESEVDIMRQRRGYRIGVALAAA